MYFFYYLGDVIVCFNVSMCLLLLGFIFISQIACFYVFFVFVFLFPVLTVKCLFYVKHIELLLCMKCAI